MSKTGFAASSMSVMGLFLLVVAFSTTHWLETDGNLEQPGLMELGLWSVCFKDFEFAPSLNDVKFVNCSWVFDDRFNIGDSFLLRGFYILTQFWFCACILLTLIGMCYNARCMDANISNEGYAQFQRTLGSLYATAAVFGTIALLIFAANEHQRMWLPNWEHNTVGWSFVVAVAGTACIYVSSALYLIEERLYQMYRIQIATQIMNNVTSL